MAVLSDNDRTTVCTLFMRKEANVNGGAGVVTKAELQAAVNAVDSWVDSNAASFNAAIPQPARGALSAAQKAALLQYVVQKRFEVA